MEELKEVLERLTKLSDRLENVAKLSEENVEVLKRILEEE
jgi:hypothetical protein